MYTCELINTISIYKSSIDSFLDRVSSATTSVLGYHYPVYLEMLESIGVGDFHGVMVKSENEIIAFLPGFIKKSDHGVVYSSMPFFGPNAGLIYSSDEEDVEALHGAAFNFLLKSFQDFSMISMSIYSPFQNDNIQELYRDFISPTVVVDKFTSFVNLENLNLSTSLQYDIRKAIKSGVVVNTEVTRQNIQAVYDIYSKNCQDYGIPPKPYECIEILMNGSSDSGVTETYMAYHEGVLIGALIMIYSKSTASYYLPCSIHEYRSFQPTTLLIKHAMDRCIERGIKVWNWESSPTKESGVFKFKMKWGSEDGSYRVYVRAFKDADFFRSLGMDEISRNFPYYFVYPFNLL
jgi:Acetyltransferase (GNAT) domain